MTSLAVVLGTYNRRGLLQGAVESVRRSWGGTTLTRRLIIVVDGGSTDGSREWLAAQPDVDLICQEGPLTGAVRAFNLGFGRAVDAGFDYVMQMNDDAEIISPVDALSRAVALLQDEPSLGALAFEFDTWGEWGFDSIYGLPYINFGVIRVATGMTVAVVQGDPTGRAWWNPVYRTYGADTEFGCWMRRLGHTIRRLEGFRVHDLLAQDELRVLNVGTDPERTDSKLFYRRWPDAVHLAPDGPPPITVTSETCNVS
jgi:glycosyltransferase involved in cell wall biosynthesis